MKKHLRLIKNDKGFFLPLVLVVSIVTLSTLITTVYIYKNELQATDLLLQQLDVETMKSITIERFKQEKQYIETDHGEFDYQLFNSHAYGHYEVIGNDVIMSIYAETDDLTYHFSYQFLINVD